MDCIACGENKLDKNTIGINKKLLGRNINNFYCIDCLADYMSTTKEELFEKIEEFKDDGCKLFN